MPTQHVATLLGATCCVRLATVLRHAATCCNMLGVVGSSLKLVKFEPTTPKMLQHVATRWPNTLSSVAICCVGMLRLFGRGFTPVKGENLQNYFGFAFRIVWVSR